MDARARRLLLGAIPLLTILIVWEALSRAGAITILLSSPSAIGESFWTLLSTDTASGYPVLLVHTAYSLYQLAIGFFIALAAGILLGAATGLSSKVYLLLEPIVYRPSLPSVPGLQIHLVWHWFSPCCCIQQLCQVDHTQPFCLCGSSRSVGT